MLGGNRGLDWVSVGGTDVIGGVTGGVADYIAQTALPRKRSGVQECDGGEGSIASNLGYVYINFVREEIIQYLAQ